MNSYGAITYSSDSEDPQWLLENIPDEVALRIDLRYKTGKILSLVYTEMPSQKEQMNLMWQLQRVAGEGFYVLYRTEADGTTTEVAPLNMGH